MDLHSIDILPIDVRRMIQFGVIKGFLRRVFAYPIHVDHPAFSRDPAASITSAYSDRPPLSSRYPPTPTARSRSRPGLERHNSSSIFGSSPPSTGSPPGSSSHLPLRDAPALPRLRTALPPTTLGDGTASSPTTGGGGGGGGGGGEGPQFPAELPLMLDGRHHTDEICVTHGIPWRYLERCLRVIGAGGEGEDAGGGGGEGKRRGSGEAVGYGTRVVIIFQ